MISILRPRRGKKATAETQNIVLKRGEVFFESPDTGVGTGTGRIKIGDGTTPYKDLPYFIDTTNLDIDVDDSVVEFEYTGNNSTVVDILNKDIVSGNKLKDLIGAIKQAISVLKTSLEKTNSTVSATAQAVNQHESDIGTLVTSVGTNTSNISSLSNTVSYHTSRINTLTERMIAYGNLKFGSVTIIPEDLGFTDTIDISAGGFKNISADLMDLILDKACDRYGDGYMIPVLSINWIHVISYNNPPLNVYIGDNDTYIFLVNNETSSVSIDAIKVYITYMT